MFQHSIGQLRKSKRIVAGRTVFLPDIFFLDPSNRVLSADSTVVARIPNACSGLIALLLVALLLFVFLAILGVSVLGSEAQLDGSSTAIRGVVVSHRHASAGSMNQGVLHYVTYRYSIPGQATAFTKEQFVTQTTYDRLADGDAVTIRYLQTDPTVAELSGSDSTNSIAQNGYFMTVFGMVGALIALVFLISHVWQFCRDDVLVRKGRLLMGEVVKCRADLAVTKTSLDTNNYGSPLRGSYNIELTYRFTTPEGKEIESSAKARRNDLVDSCLPELGTPIAVLYLSERRYKIL